MSRSHPPHPLAELFPPMTGADFDALVADVQQNGLLDPIVLYDNQILDGRHRYRACQQLGVEPITVEWTGPGTPEAFVISKNLHRRQLTESQRAVIAAKLANFGHGGKRQAANLPVDADLRQPANLPVGISQAKAAEMLNVSERSVRTAATVVKKGEPEMVRAVDRGDIKVSAAAKLVDLPAARQRELASAPKRTVAKAVKRMSRRPRADAISPTHFTDDPDFQAEAEAAARDLEIERDERIALSGGGELAAENERLNKQIRLLDRRINALINENSSLKYRERMWKERALAAGWKGPRADA
jgi:ParB-like chromosome segregation protein Spo0J